MKYLWDTDTCVYFLNGDEKIARMTQLIGAENICTTIVNLTELKFGAYNSRRVKSNLERIECFKSKLLILNDFDDELGSIFAKNKSHLRQNGLSVGDFDLLIASFAIANNLILVTNNTRHFKDIPALKIENWAS